MRDLRSRLRAIVQQDKARAAENAGDAPVRELTYEPDLTIDGGPDLPPAPRLRRTRRSSKSGGGQVRPDAADRFVSIDTVWDAQDFHGRRRLESYAIPPDAPVRLFDPRLRADPGWHSRLVFFDIETTGLTGGAGTVAFLAGCGWFEDGGFRVRQFFLVGPAGESRMLDALGEIFDSATMLVTYNGRTFDVPTMDTRWAFHRRDSRAEGVPHFDMLPAARRLWGGIRAGDVRSADLPPSREATADRRSLGGGGQIRAGNSSSCTLSSIERSVLGFHRRHDVAGFEIPSRYFQFLRTGDPSVVAGVLEHNRHDVISLAVVTAHALQLAADGPEACRDAGEQAALGRLYERAGDLTRAAHAYERAAGSADGELRAHVLARLAVLLRRARRHAESAEAWEDVFQSTWNRHGVESPLGCRAAEALAIHHEHRVGDLDRARRYAQMLERAGRGRTAAAARHRLDRLQRKMSSGRLF
jgi:uncharacterized protein YprB with RNaseH-like and TPR domain